MSGIEPQLFIENRTFDEIELGDRASLVRTLSRDDIELFAVMSGDVNPAHVDDEYAHSDIFHRVIAHAAAALAPRSWGWEGWRASDKPGGS